MVEERYLEDGSEHSHPETSVSYVAYVEDEVAEVESAEGLLPGEDHALDDVILSYLVFVLKVRVGDGSWDGISNL